MAPSKDSSAVTNGTDGKALLQGFLNDNSDVKFLRLQFMDQSSVLRSIVLPIKSALRVAKQGSLKAPASPWANLISLMDRPVLENGEIGVSVLEPDWSSLRVCAYCPTHAAVMCFVRQQIEHAPRDGYALCPRHQLIRQLERHADTNFLVGWEIEFQLLDDDKLTAPPRPQACMGGAALRSRFSPVMDEIMLALDSVGIDMFKYHGEEPYEGFFEMSLMPLPPLEAADSFIYCHETVKGIAAKNGMFATMFPVPFEAAGPRIGSHVHFSISKTENEEGFLAGLLHAMPALTAFNTPNVDSYVRMTKSYLTWGHENKTTIVRWCDPGHWEIRNTDATMNPYLVLAGLVMSGMDGVHKQKKPHIQPLDKLTRKIDDELREKLNINTRMPTSLSESLALVEQDSVLCEGFGPEFMEGFLNLKREEVEGMASLTGAQRAARSVRVF